MLNASTKNCVLHCRACLRVKVPVVCGVFERAVWSTLVAASVASGIGGSRAPTKDSASSTLTMTCSLGGSATTGAATGQKEWTCRDLLPC